jgi:hypothetical protein
VRQLACAHTVRRCDTAGRTRRTGAHLPVRVHRVRITARGAAELHRRAADSLPAVRWPVAQGVQRGGCGVQGLRLLPQRQPARARRLPPPTQSTSDGASKTDAKADKSRDAKPDKAAASKPAGGGKQRQGWQRQHVPAVAPPARRAPAAPPPDRPTPRPSASSRVLIRAISGARPRELGPVDHPRRPNRRPPTVPDMDRARLLLIRGAAPGARWLHAGARWPPWRLPLQWQRRVQAARPADPPTEQAVVVVSDLPPGHVLQRDDVRARQVPTDLLPQGALGVEDPPRGSAGRGTPAGRPAAHRPQRGFADGVAVAPTRHRSGDRSHHRPGRDRDGRGG